MIQIDMPMPKNCLDCPACNEYLTCAIPVNGRKWGENDVREFGQGRPEWCPLKEQEADKKDAEYMPMEVVPVTIGNDYRTWLCSACGSKLHYGKELICPKCHRKIDWEGR